MDREFKPLVIGTITATGGFKPDNADLYDLLFKHFKAGATVSLTVKKHGKTRSLNQNAFLWGCVVPVFFKWCKDNGHDNIRCLEDAYELLLAAVNPTTEIDLGTGKIYTFAERSKSLSTIDFNTFFQRAIQFISEISGNTINIPYPNECEIIENNIYKNQPKIPKSPTLVN